MVLGDFFTYYIFKAHMLVLYSTTKFLFPNNIPWYEWDTLYLSLHSLKDSWVVSNFQL